MLFSSAVCIWKCTEGTRSVLVWHFCYCINKKMKKKSWRWRAVDGSSLCWASKRRKNPALEIDRRHWWGRSDLGSSLAPSEARQTGWYLWPVGGSLLNNHTDILVKTYSLGKKQKSKRKISILLLKSNSALFHQSFGLLTCLPCLSLAPSGRAEWHCCLQKCHLGDST